MTRRLHGATGALVVSTALLIGGAGGTVAAADTGTSDSSSRGSETAGQAPASNSSRDSVADGRESIRATLRDVVRSATSTVDSRRDRAFEPSQDDSTQSADADQDSVAAVVDGDESVAGAPEDDVAVGTELIEGQPVAETPTQPAEPEVVATTPVEIGPDTSDSDAAGPATGNSTGGSDAPESTGSGSASPYGPPSTDQGVGEESGTVVKPTPIIRVVTTMTTVVVSLGSAAAAIPPVVFSLPFSQTPVSDIIALLEAVLTSVGESATAVAQLPSDFAALFGVDLTGPRPVLIGAPSDRHVELLSVGSAPPVAGPQTSLLPMAPERPFDVLGAQSGLAPSLPTALTAYTAPSLAVPTSMSARMGEHQSLIDRAFGALLVPLSLWALATGALPGLAGMLIIFGAGIRVGYRQAKAGFMVKVAGIARFAGPGPLGVVRSGSLVALHQRRVGAEGPRALRWSQLGDQAA